MTSSNLSAFASRVWCVSLGLHGLHKLETPRELRLSLLVSRHVALSSLEQTANDHDAADEAGAEDCEYHDRKDFKFLVTFATSPKASET